MQIVINIPEDVHERIKRLVDDDCFSHDIVGANMKRIAKGTPLPKGHGRLIDENDLIHEDIKCADGYEYDIVHAGYIDSAPTIIEAESED